MSVEREIGFEVAKIVVGASVPTLLAYFGWTINKRLKSIDHAQWQNRKIIEIRLDLYTELAPNLNSMYCFCRWLGDWKEISPVEMILMKRTSDKTVNVYRHLLSEKFYKAYNTFIHTIFRPFAGANLNAKIRSHITSAYGDRSAVFASEWKPAWNSMFDTEDVADFKDLQKSYNNMMNEFRLCIGLSESDLK